MKILFKNIRGIYSATKTHEVSFKKGPINILVDETTKKILQINNEQLKADKEINCDGLIATPGFIDSHTHALFGGNRWDEFFQRWKGADYAAINAAGGGIRKTFRDTRACSDEELIAKLISDCEKIYAEGVRVLEVKSGYGETMDEELRILRLIKEAKEKSPVEIVSTFLGLHAIPQKSDEATWVKESVAVLGKIKSEKLAEFVDSFPEKGFFSLESSRIFSKAAIELGFKVKIHADEITAMGAAKMGAELGAASVDHLQKISDEALTLLSRSKTVATLLPATSFYLGLPYAPARKIIDAGARVALATDYNPGTAPNSSLQFTAMLAASQMKMTAAEIFCALSSNAAAAVNREGSYGLIKENYSSEILFWDLKSESHLEEMLLSGTKPQNP
jgi:imidazolonepropionase